MKSALALALLVAAAPVAAHEHRTTNVGCNVGTDWSVRQYRSAFLFSTSRIESRRRAASLRVSRFAGLFGLMRARNSASLA